MKTNKTPLCSYTYFAFVLNCLIERQPQRDLSFREVFDAAADECLLKLLDTRYGNTDLAMHNSRRIWYRQAALLRPSPRRGQLSLGTAEIVRAEACPERVRLVRQLSRPSVTFHASLTPNS